MDGCSVDAGVSAAMKPALKKWYVLHVWYTGQDGKRKIATSIPSDDFAAMHSDLVQKRGLGFDAEMTEVRQPRVKKVLTKRQREDLYQRTLFDLGDRKKRGLHDK